MSCAVLPASCQLCEHPLLRLSVLPVCDDCWIRIHPQADNLCLRCGEKLAMAQLSTPNDWQPTADAKRLQLCRPCESAPPDFETAFAFGVYESELRRMIHLLKYDRMEPVASRLGRFLAPQVIAALRPAADEVLVVPVPLHRSKQKERGFNQSLLLARETLHAARKQDPSLRLRLAPGILERRKATESQSGLNPSQRRRNLRGAFFVPAAGRQQLAGKDVLLIDDIYTTGATARACSRVLKQAGAARVWVATVARAQREGAIRWEPENWNKRMPQDTNNGVLVRV